MRYLATCLVALSLHPMTAWADGAINGLTYSGVTKVENLSIDNRSKTFAYSRLDAGYRVPLGEGYAFGVDLGFDGVQHKGQRGDADYLAAVVASPYGKLSVGMPRLVMPQVFDTPAIGGSEVTQLAAGIASGEIISDLNLMANAPVLRGLRYDGSFGKVTMAAAIHEFANSTVPLRQLAVTYNGGDWSASVGTQGIHLGGPYNEHQIKLVLRGEQGKISGGMVATHQYIGKLRENALELFGAYEVTDAVKVEGQLIDVVLEGRAHMAWGGDVIYTLPSGAFLQAGLTRIDTNAQSLVDVGVGFKF